jgi:hypothetical protein
VPHTAIEKAMNPGDEVRFVKDVKKNIDVLYVIVAIDGGVCWLRRMSDGENFWGWLHALERSPE